MGYVNHQLDQRLLRDSRVTCSSDMFLQLIYTALRGQAGLLLQVGVPSG
jgi:hypothetical protein